MAAANGAYHGEILPFSDAQIGQFNGTFYAISAQPQGASPYFINQGWYAVGGVREMWPTYGAPAPSAVNPYTGHVVTELMYDTYFL